MKKMTKKGVLDYSYHVNRKHKRTHKYRLKRRTYEVIKCIEPFYEYDSQINILDIGSADGMMLSSIKNKYFNSNSIGFEYSFDLINAIKDNNIEKICGDAQALPFKHNSFDIVIACAIIEHIPNPNIFIENILHTLKKGGILIITTPVPFWESIFTKIGHLEENQHYKTLSLTDLDDLIKKKGMVTLMKKKFMMSPVGFPFEISIEKILTLLRINLFMGNQIIIGRK
jgi:2-polyprenyl-3-methyl-5-hydroxy-6-metoxy-1,4-benzoquinol methylase